MRTPTVRHSFDSQAANPNCCTLTPYCTCFHCVELQRRLQCHYSTTTQSNISLKEQEKVINKKAVSLAKEYLAANSSDLPFNKVFLVYKFDETPEAMIMQAINTMGDADRARFYFKGIARLVHPDKNSHP